MNRLKDESSPYLLQHADNPVDWYPWGDEAFRRAREENKPIFLSVGYSACHWCHVMEHECFENAEIAGLMNENFVNIKVDREERPDVDHIYMSAVQMLTGHGGWPMSVFLTPEGKPFYGGTYFPPEDRKGMPGFPRLLQGLANAYQAESEDIAKNVEQLMNALAKMDRHVAHDEPPGVEAVEAAAEQLAGLYDAANGGIGQAPKFPNESVFELFARTFVATGEERYGEMFLETLRRMARGGIYDQLGGGFHRYSVDAHWLVPHFEKMLYDNAQLVPLYLAAYQLSGEDTFARIARETLDYVEREMRDPNGGFYSSQDADSESVEGKFFVWSRHEVEELIADEDIELICRYWDIVEEGNFEGSNILHMTLEPKFIARRFKRDEADVRQTIAGARATLLEARSKRVAPGRDEKILTAWNGLMISAYAKAAEALNDGRYAQIAIDGIDFIERELQIGHRLQSAFKDGVAKLNGYLDDYAFFLAALLDVFELTQDRSYLDKARAIATATIDHFWDNDAGGFFFTSDDHEQLIVRSKPSFDGSIPSGNSVMARNLVRLDALTGDRRFGERAATLLRLHAGTMAKQPFGAANMLCALDFYGRTAKEIVVVGAAEAPETRDLLQAARARYLPNRVLTQIDPQQAADRPAILGGKGLVNGKPAAYVCERMTCSAPATSAAELQERIR